jgi:hypothetical protein
MREYWREPENSMMLTLRMNIKRNKIGTAPRRNGVEECNNRWSKETNVHKKNIKKKCNAIQIINQRAEVLHTLPHNWMQPVRIYVSWNYTLKEAKFTLEQAMKAQRESTAIALLFNFARHATGKEIRYPLYRTDGSQGRSKCLQKISSPPGFDSRTVQPVASRYTDYKILAL